MTDLKKYVRLEQLKKEREKFLSSKNEKIEEIKKDVYLEYFKNDYDNNVPNDIKELLNNVKKQKRKKTVVGIFLMALSIPFFLFFCYLTSNFDKFKSNGNLIALIFYAMIVPIIIGIIILKSKRKVPQGQLKKFLSEHNEYNFSYSTSKEAFMMDSTYVLKIEDIPKFNSDLTFYKPKKYQDLNGFLSSNDEANNKVNNKIEKLEQKYTDIESEITNLKEELAIPERFFASENFLGMIINIFEDNKEIKTSQQAIQFVLKTFIETNPTTLFSNCNSFNSISEIIEISNDYFSKDYLPNF